jgi:hypothetical protein
MNWFGIGGVGVGGDGAKESVRNKLAVFCRCQYPWDRVWSGIGCVGVEWDRSI